MELSPPLPVKSSPRLVYSPHPLFVAVDRKQIHMPYLPGESIATYLHRVGINLAGRPVFLQLNDRFIERSEWGSTFPQPGDIIVIRARVQDGGGEGGSDPLRIILSIAVLTLFAPWAAGHLGFAAGGFGEALIATAGLLVVNQLFPPPEPITSDNDSPTYSLSASGNRARPYEPLPLILGQHRVYPDLGAKPYTEFIGEDQYLYQVFNFGLADVDLTTFKIGDTPVANFDHVELEVSGPDGALGLFPSNVDTVNGGALTVVADWIQRTSSIDATALSIDISGLLFISNSKGIQPLCAEIDIQYRAVGAGTWIDVTLQATPPDPTAGVVTGIVYDVKDTILGAGQLRIQNGNRKPLRRAYRWNVESDQYEVRVQVSRFAYPKETCVWDDNLGEMVCTTTYPTISQEHGDVTASIAWNQLKTYQPDTADYTGQIRVAMKIKASAQLNGAVDAFNIIAAATVPAWVTSAPALSFDGALSQSVDVPDDETIDHGLTDFSVEVLFKHPTGAVNPKWAMGKGEAWSQPGGLGYGISCWQPADTDVNTGFYLNDGTNKFTVGIVVERGKAILIIWVVDRTANTLTGYQDGVPIGQVDITGLGDISNTSALKIGNMAGSYYTGVIYLYRQYGRTLSANEAAEHAAGIYNDESGLVLHHQYDTGSGTTAYDRSGNGNDGALTNGPTWVTASWTDPAWVPQATSNPARLFLWLARGKKISSRRVFGGDLPDSRIDIEAIKAWGTWCDTKALACNLVFDSQMSVNEQLAVAARCGRGSPTWASGTLGAVWDEDSQPSVQVFGMNNIRRDSFAVDYLTEKLAEEVIVRFINPDLNWQPDTVRVNTPGVVTPEVSTTVEIPGITDKDQAGKEANLLAAANAYRRRRITWESDFEGMVVQRGDVATLSHDLTQWGYSGRLVAGTATVLQLDRKVPFTPSTNHYIGVRFPDGSYSIYDVVYQVGESDTITLSTALPSAPDSDPNHPPLDYTWVFEPEATPGKLVKIIDVSPIDEHHVRLVATDEDPDYYTAELNSYTYVTPATYGTDVPTIDVLDVYDTLVRSGDGFGVRVSLVWDVTGEYGGARIRVGFNGEPLELIGQTFDRRFEFEGPLTGTVDVEVTALNLSNKYGPSSTATANYTILGKDRLPEDVTGFVAMQNGSVIVFRWSQVADVDVAGYEIRYGPQTETSWEDATALTKVTKGTTITSAAIPPGSWRTYIKAVDTSGNFSASAPVADVEYINTYDIIEQQTQAPDWPGTLTNFVKHWTGVLIPDDQNLADTYTNFEWCDQFVPTPFDQCIYEAPEIDIGFDDVVRIWGDIISALGPGVVVGEAIPQLQIDYRKDADAYGGWRDWDVGDVEARYSKFRLVLDTTVGKAKVTGFKPTADQLEDTVQMQDVVIAAAGSVVTYPREFHRIPMVKVNVQGGSALFATRENISTPQCTVHVWNSSGTDVGGTVDIEITGV